MFNRECIVRVLHIQNQIIHVLGDHIQRKILLRVQTAQCFTMIADEVADCSNKEQLCITYVDPDIYAICEALITILECYDGISEEALTNKMLNFLTQHLDLTKLCGQAYDGAGNMSGKRNGAAACITSLLLCTYTVPLIVLT